MKNVEEVMRRNIEFCVSETRIPDMLYLFKKYNYDDLFVLDSETSHHIIGVVHQNSVSDEMLKNSIRPFNMKALKCMEKIERTVDKKMSLLDCKNIMDDLHLSYIPVVDKNSRCVGVLFKSDIEVSQFL